VLNIEKRNQNLRDDILQMNNLNPSYTRQMASSGGGSGSYEEYDCQKTCTYWCKRL
jgi:hypothetical protein